MVRSRTRWVWVVISAALSAGISLGFLGWRRSELAGEHASRAQKALNEMSRYKFDLEYVAAKSQKRIRPSERAAYEAMAKYANAKLARLEEVAARHERLARSYGHTEPFKRPEPEP
jgi:hypothetical protein